MSIAPDLIINSTYVTHTLNNLWQDDEETIKYYIHDNREYSIPVGYGYANSLEHTIVEEAFIESIFKSLDFLIDLDFERMSHYWGSDIDIYSLNYHSSWEDRTAGTAWGMKSGSAHWWEIGWKDTVNYEFDRNTIVHEIGHVLGLDHPEGIGTNPSYDSYDTVMSYNENVNGWSMNWTSSDLKALTNIWGIENDSYGEDDIRSGSIKNDVIVSGKGDDIIYGWEGEDDLFGGSGADSIYGGDGNDMIRGGDGNDYLLGGKWSFADRIIGEDGEDFLGGGGGPDSIFGNTGKDEIRAGHGKDYLDGGSGGDTLYGGGGANTFAGELDGAIDNLYVMSDSRGHNYDWGRNHDGVNADVITEIDIDDTITILGTSDENLSFRQVESGSFNQDKAGIGIFDGEVLEAIYIGSHLTMSGVEEITTADDSRFW